MGAVDGIIEQVLGGTKMGSIREQKQRHGEALKRFFGLPDFTDAVALVKELQTLERRAHRYTENYCNGIVDEKASERIEDSIYKQLSAFGISRDKVFINGDCRGYALKIREEYSKTFDGDKDWGGYGILGPKFSN